MTCTLYLVLAVGLVLANEPAAAFAGEQDDAASPPEYAPKASAGAAPSPAGPTAGVLPGPLMPIGSAYSGLSGAGLFDKMLEYDRKRDASLQEYSSLRTYSVVNDKGRTSAQEVIEMEFHAPDHKTFVTRSASGSGLIRDLVLERLVQSEKETASGRAHRESDLNPDNYRLTLVGEQDVGPYHCLVAEVTPKRREHYLFQGKVWVSTHDFGVVRMAGHPSKPPSFWVTRAEFVRQYEKVGDFWLPSEDETVAQVRFNGRKTLRVKYGDYEVNGTRIPPAPASTGHAP